MERYPNDNEQHREYHDPYAQQQHSNPYPPYPPYPPHLPAKTNSKAIVALVLGILSIVIPYIGLLFGIVAIVFASMSFKEIRLRQEQGRGMAVAGMVCGIIGTAIYGIILLIVVIAIIAFSGNASDIVYY
ncbi:DUF4190 domain-containing protein [Paenibacillus daejeonensis]|uniref:DUF4190 domain-containing protein n=1 Tax=Paenibacillus daejeonensis TaxID=135193 RepID=UPI00037E7A88|nr:DUF4190 domain-containing protein [Paenibacillus daejeonensis]